ncbi:hypothetical protein A3G06_01270 [Candidatus Nomurabacteria bacterium RIFCSPLOWO2_12_FULL_46_14]|uniref:Diacylglycerol kinase n=1 Tax=Candidatus Nomurabacteria bacterium RIFCSPLOWO2_12_FULL_46_14 TaxID=1801797 RepID=A0A1F6Y835_9BACT|nr:MAG: hypothetical protein A3G06_01270 [Candidatus Nomurabacteria bacterium RIFCSPLOWO2_12_FULL_46_14]
MSNKNLSENSWRQVKYRKRFLNALRGMYVLFKTTRHAYVYLAVTLTVILLGFYLKISPLEWVALTFAIGLVFVVEAINTAIEIDIDLTSPTFHPYARDTKDVAAAAVLLSVFVAIITGLIVFLPKIL